MQISSSASIQLSPVIILFLLTFSSLPQPTFQSKIVAKSSSDHHALLWKVYRDSSTFPCLFLESEVTVLIREKEGFASIVIPAPNNASSSLRASGSCGVEDTSASEKVVLTLPIPPTENSLVESLQIIFVYDKSSKTYLMEKVRLLHLDLKHKNAWLDLTPLPNPLKGADVGKHSVCGEIVWITRYVSERVTRTIEVAFTQMKYEFFPQPEPIVEANNTEDEASEKEKVYDPDYASNLSPDNVLTCPHPDYHDGSSEGSSSMTVKPLWAILALVLAVIACVLGGLCIRMTFFKKSGFNIIRSG